MRRAAVLIAIFAGLAATPAFAEPGRLGGLGANLFGNSFFHFGEANMKSFPVSSVGLGRIRVQLQRTKLSDIQRVFGGTIYEEGQGMGAAHWLCYSSDKASTWFMSNMLGGGEFVMMVAAQAGPGAGSCDAAPANMPLPEMGIPGLGAPIAELKEKFGAAPMGSHSDVSYRADRPAKDGLGTANDAQYIGYVVRGGTVVGVGVGETTAQ